MLVFLPVLILLAAAITGALLVLLNRGGGFIWAISFISAMAIWIFVLAVPVNSYQSVLISQWLPFSQVFSGLTFKIDLTSFPFVLCMTSLLLSFVITSTIHLKMANWSRETIVVLLIGSLGILSLVSLDPFSLVLIWTILDFCCLGTDLWFAEDIKEKQFAITSFVLKTMGSFAIMGGVVASGGKGFNFDLANIPTQVGFLFLLAIVLRFWGVLNHFPKKTGKNNYSTQILIKLIPLATIFALLSRLPSFEPSRTGYGWIILSIILLGLWSAVHVMLASDLPSALPFFLTGFGTLAIYCILKNQPTAVIAWGCLALLIGGLLGSFEKFFKLHSILPSFGLLLSIGIPFTLGAMGLKGIVNPFSASAIVLVIVFLGLLVGTARTVWQKDFSIMTVERPILIVYTIGASLLPLTSFILAIKLIQEFPIKNDWLISVILLVVGISLSVVYYRVRSTFHPQETANNLIHLYRQIQNILKFNLPGKLLQALIRVMSLSVQMLSTVLEGDGGVLWTLVLLAVMISVIAPGSS